MRILNIFNLIEKRKLILLLLVMQLAMFLEIIGLGILINLLDLILSGKESFSNSIIANLFTNFFSGFNLSLKKLIFILGIVFIIKIIFLIYTSWYEAKFVYEFKEKLSYQLFNNFLYNEIDYIKNIKSTEHIRNFTTEIDNVTTFVYCSVKVLLDLIAIFSILIFLFIFDIFVTLIIIMLISLTFIIYYSLIKNFLYYSGKKRSGSQNKKLQFIKESFSIINFLKILSKEKFFLDKFKFHNSVLTRISINFSFLNSLPKFIFEFLLFITALMIIIILNQYNYNNNEIIKIITIFLAAFYRMIPAVNRLLSNIQNIKYNYFSAKIVEKCLTKNICYVSENKKLKSNNFIFKKEILIKIKSFHYNKKNIIFKDFKLKIKKFEKIGIIGATGAGKTTLINIICGFIRNDNFNILVDGTSIFSRLREWQRKIGYMPQQTILLNETIKNNIIFGSQNNVKFNPKRFNKIMDQTNLSSFINKFRNKIDHVLSEDGDNISGGERQRIALARALIGDPDLLILDEPTSSLDFVAEKKILEELNKLKITMIIISHKINSLRFCDKIYELNNNKLNLVNKNYKFL